MERGTSRRVLCERLRESTGHDISTNTLATYEMGTRQPPLERIVALCLTQDVRLSEILAAVESELLDGSDNALTVNLRTIAKTTSIVLSPVRGWARSHLDAGRTTAELTTDSIANLATASGLDATEIRAALLAHARGRQNGGSR